MKAIRNATLSAMCFALVTAAAPAANAGYGSYGCSPYGLQGGYGYDSSYQYGYNRQRIVKIPAGSMITIPGFFGAKPGPVFLFVAGAKYHVKVVAFTPKSMKMLMPFLKLAKAAPGRLLVFGLDGRVHRSFAVLMLPPVIKKIVIPPVKGVAPLIKGVVPAKKTGNLPGKINVSPKKELQKGNAGVKPQPQIIVEPAPAKPISIPKKKEVVSPPVKAVAPLIKGVVPAKKTGNLTGKINVSPKKEVKKGNAGVKPQPQIVVEPAPAKPISIPEKMEGIALLPQADQAAALAQKTCPVTEGLLGSLGKPIKVLVQGQTIFVCCAACIEKLKKNPQKFLQKRP